MTMGFFRFFSTCFPRLLSWFAENTKIAGWWFPTHFFKIVNPECLGKWNPIRRLRIFFHLGCSKKPPTSRWRPFPNQSVTCGCEKSFNITSRSWGYLRKSCERRMGDPRTWSRSRQDRIVPPIFLKPWSWVIWKGATTSHVTRSLGDENNQHSMGCENHVSKSWEPILQVQTLWAIIVARYVPSRRDEFANSSRL